MIILICGRTWLTQTNKMIHEMLYLNEFLEITVYIFVFYGKESSEN